MNPPFHISTVILEDVQALEGGRSIYIQRDGDLFVRRVDTPSQDPWLHEKRYVSKVSEKSLSHLESLVKKHDFFHLQIPARKGALDEPKPKLTIRLKSGEERTIEKWERDKNPRFDPIYQWLLDLAIKATKEGKLVFEGAYDPGWRPPF